MTAVVGRSSARHGSPSGRTSRPAHAIREFHPLSDNDRRLRRPADAGRLLRGRTRGRVRDASLRVRRGDPAADLPGVRRRVRQPVRGQPGALRLEGVHQPGAGPPGERGRAGARRGVGRRAGSRPGGGNTPGRHLLPRQQQGAGRAGDGPGLRRRPDRGGQLQRDGAARRPGPVPRCRAGRHAAALARRRPPHSRPHDDRHSGQQVRLRHRDGGRRGGDAPAP